MTGNNNSSNRSKKRVLVLTHNYPRWGGDVSGGFIEHLLGLLRDSFDFTVVCPHDSGLSFDESSTNARIIRFRYGREAAETLAYRGEMHSYLKSRPISVIRFLLSYRDYAYRVAASGKYDIIWAHWWIPGGWAGMKAASKSNTPLVVTCHGTDIFLLRKFAMLRRLGSRVFSQAGKITVVSTFLRDELTAMLGGRTADISERISVAPMPVNSRAFYFRKDISRKPGSIIAASRLTAQKHHDTLVHAAGRLASDGIPFQIDIYGTGPERENLQQLISAKGLTDTVRINEPLPQVELGDRYRSSEIAVLPSEREGFGLMLAEAMLCGCAAVGADSGGVKDIVLREGSDGMLVKPSDVNALYTALKSLLSDRGKLERLQLSGRASAEDRFSATAVASHFGDILTDASRIGPGNA